jgi:F0F1-type ATP synthase epsilon subunit
MSQKPKDKVMRVEIHSMAGSPLVLENVSTFNVLLSDGGWLGILPGHTHLVAATVEGEARYTIGEEQLTKHISSGILSVADNVVSILTTK